jgi:hypothetical protein
VLYAADVQTKSGEYDLVTFVPIGAALRKLR